MCIHEHSMLGTLGGQPCAHVGHGRRAVCTRSCVCVCVCTRVSVDPAAANTSHTLNSVSAPSTEQALEIRALSHLNFDAALPGRYCHCPGPDEAAECREVPATDSAKMRLTTESGAPERSL